MIPWGRAPLRGMIVRDGRGVKRIAAPARRLQHLAIPYHCVGRYGQREASLVHDLEQRQGEGPQHSLHPQRLAIKR